MKTLTWAQINFEKRYLAVGRSKTEAGEGRTIPLNSRSARRAQCLFGVVHGAVWRDPARMVRVPIRQAAAE